MPDPCRPPARPFTIRLSRVVTPCLFAALAGCLSVQSPSVPVTVKRAQMHMGTLVTLTAVAPSEKAAQQAVTAGFQEIHRLEEILSTWIPASDLSRVNAAAGREPVRVAPEALHLVKRSLELAALTDGGFNIAVGPAVELWSVTDRTYIPTNDELARLKPLADLSLVRLDEQAGTIFLEQLGMRIDVGGIGKGYAADRAVEVMQRAGATAGVAALSGDIKTFGHMPAGHRFRFGIRHPREPGVVLATLDMENEAISTAGDYERYFERDGVRYHHILDPQTLQPARRCQSVTVVATEGTLADGLDTGLFVMGPERAMALVERLDGVDAVIVDEAGHVHVSSGLKERLHILEPVP